MIDVDIRPETARVTEAMVGSSTGERPVIWSERETMLYALGVGAGLDDPTRELGFTTENSDGVTLQPVPSFLTILAVGQRPPAMASLDVGRFLHAGQKIELFRPLPTSGRGFVNTTIESVTDNGAGAILTNIATLRDEADLAPIGQARSSIFVRGAGGFGGPRRVKCESALPRRRPDVRIEYRTRPDQALLYRLSGDRHRLHSDTSFARMQGFDRPILHGLCTYGFACRALIQGAADGDPSRLRSMDGRFTKPAYPGETLTTEMWFEDDGGLKFRTLNSSGEIVIDRGVATMTI